MILFTSDSGIPLESHCDMPQVLGNCIVRQNQQALKQCPFISCWIRQPWRSTTFLVNGARDSNSQGKQAMQIFSSSWALYKALPISQSCSFPGTQLQLSGLYFLRMKPTNSGGTCILAPQYNGSVGTRNICEIMRTRMISDMQGTHIKLIWNLAEDTGAASPRATWWVYCWMGCIVRDSESLGSPSFLMGLA